MTCHKKPYCSVGSGFSLVEMSVVLIVISFVLMAVMKGQDMAHKARLDSAIADLQKYKSAAKQFRMKYYYLPGDIPNPTQHMSACTDAAGNTCAGNGDGQILRDGSTREETLRAWQHMALTELIPGKFTGVRNVTTTSGVTLGRLDGTDNIPASRLEYILGGQGGYWFSYNTTAPFTGNYLLLGRDPVSVLTDSALNGILSPKNAGSIDRKIDDGHAQSGLLIAAASAVAPTTCLDATPDYVAGDDTQGCVLWFNID